MGGHREREFEDAIEAHLLDQGWRKGQAGDYAVELGLDPVVLAEFVQATQPKEWDKLLAGYGSAAPAKSLGGWRTRSTSTAQCTCSARGCGTAAPTSAWRTSSPPTG